MRPIPHSYKVFYQKKNELPKPGIFGFTTKRQDMMTRKQFIINVVNTCRLIAGAIEYKENEFDFKNWHIRKD